MKGVRGSKIISVESGKPSYTQSCSLPSFKSSLTGGDSSLYKDPIILVGQGSELINTKSANGRTKRKLITNSMVLSLVDVANELEDHEARKQYWNTYHCQNSIVSSEGKVYGTYCKNRICTVCSANRKADIMNRYLPVMSSWSDAHFVTLTIKSCKAGRLNYYVKGMLKTFRKILARQKKRHQRGKGVKLVGIRSLECNFNPVKKTYNPHFHIIVQTKEMAEVIVSEWLKTINTERVKHVDRRAQKISRIKNHEKALIEVIKYGSKIFTEPDIKQGQNGQHFIYARALHNILQAMKGQRIFERFGFSLPQNCDIKTSSVKLVQNYERWTFDPARGNWTNNTTLETLTTYAAPFELLEMLAFRVDTNTS